jgi:hypothetical protein
MYVYTNMENIRLLQVRILIKQTVHQVCWSNEKKVRLKQMPMDYNDL